MGDTLSFIKGSEQLGISASAMSRRVQRLENELGAVLLLRNTRLVTLTPAGQRFLAHARQMLDSFAAALQELHNGERERATHLTLASLPSLTSQLLPNIIRRFHLRCPEIHLRIIECGAALVLEKVRDGIADFGFTFQTGREADLAFDAIAVDPYCLIAPLDHALAAHHAVCWRDLKPYAAITAGRTSANMLLLSHALRDVDWLSDTVYEIDHLTTSLGMVEAELGISVVPRSAIPDGAERRLTIRALTEPEVHRTLGLLRRRNEPLGDAARQFLLTARTSAA